MPITNIAEILEIYAPLTDDVPPPEPPEGYEPITLEELHKRGYSSPSESYERAKKDGIVDEKTDGEKRYYCGSWITGFYFPHNGYKKIECGSYTSRAWYWPDTIALKCQTYRDYVLVDDYPWWETWGWRNQHLYVGWYSGLNTFTWNQKGWHHWGGPGRTTEVWYRW